MDLNTIIENELMEEIVHFEDFFSRMGFKRIDGSVFGLLVLSRRPLRSEEIEEKLKLSQSAVSLSLKTLSQFGAIETRNALDQKQDSKAKIHCAKEDSLHIVASIFRKREEEYVREFKSMAQRVLAKSSSDTQSPRYKRMVSIINTCEIAEAVMQFIMTIAKEKGQEHFDHHYDAVVKRLPKTLELLAQSAGPLSEMTQNITQNIKDNFTHKLKSNFKGLL
jgi:DNA-binding transcriptional regulator GbsR (MarR family)